MLAQEAGQRLLGRSGARAALGGCWRPATSGATSAAQRDPARAVEAARSGRATSAARLRRPGAQVLGRAGLHARGDFLAEQFQEQLRHGQSFSAGSMSVCEKSDQVGALEQQRLAGALGKRIGEAVAKVQPRSMPAATIIIVGGAAPVSVLRDRDRHDLECKTSIRSSNRTPAEGLPRESTTMAASTNWRRTCAASARRSWPPRSAAHPPH